jgi:6-phosphogluconolactonase (cycloisomerase 2 family)
MHRRSLWRLATCAFAALLGAGAGGCSHDALFGPGGGVAVAVTTPSGVQSGDIRIVFMLSDDEVSSADVSVRYSTDGGFYFRTASAASGSAGLSDLAVSPTGITHTFVWDSADDLGEARLSGVVVRVSADGGESAMTRPFAVHNRRFLVVSHDTAAASVSLFRLDVNDGELVRLQTLSPGGSRPWDVLFEDGRFFVANRDSNDVTVLDLDQDSGSLEAIEFSPFRTDGAGSRYLATDGSRLFVANVTGETITIFDIEAETGRLNLNSHSGEPAAGCREMAAKSGRLYVASETSGAVLIFDIAASGELAPSGFSPVSSGGVATPVSLQLVGNRLYTANFATATLAGFNVQGDGDLMAIAGSPFSFTGTGALDLAASAGGDRLFLATSDLTSFASMALDALGVATEDVSSPHAAAGTIHTVVTAGRVVVVGSEDAESLESFVAAAAGTLTAGGDSPADVGDPVGRLAVSD